MRTINISDEVYNTLKLSSEKSKISIKDLTELLITKNINYLNDPVLIAEDLQKFSTENTNGNE